MARCFSTSILVGPDGAILGKYREIQDNIFNFAVHRQPDQYGLLTR